MNKKFWYTLILVTAMSLLLAACGGGQAPTTEAPKAEPTKAEAKATEAPKAEPTKAEAKATEAPKEEAKTEAPASEVPAELEYLSRAYSGEFSGSTVTVDGPFTGDDETKFLESMKAFEDATGIDVQYIGSKEFETSISVRVDAGDPPDIADFPQPGLMAGFMAQGAIVDPTSWMDEAYLKAQYNQSWLDMAMAPGADGNLQSGGIWHRFNTKSLVWYNKKAYDDAGYPVPATWDELMDVTQQIADDGDTAWCIGMESGVATGWVATDWTEEMMLRTTSLENYDKWVAGDLKFASPEVKKAVETWSNLWFNPDYVLGGRDAIVSTFIGDSPVPMFDDPPKCWFHRQANWIVSFFPDNENMTYGEDYDFFYFPPVDDQYGKPLLVAGDVMSMFNDRPEVRALMEYFTTPESVSAWLEQGGALAAQNSATADMYGSDLSRKLADLTANADSFRFDASDLMPGEVGAGSFWKSMTDYVSGAADLDTALAEIDASWPEK